MVHNSVMSTSTALVIGIVCGSVVLTIAAAAYCFYNGMTPLGEITRRLSLIKV